MRNGLGACCCFRRDLAFILKAYAPMYNRACFSRNSGFQSAASLEFISAQVPPASPLGAYSQVHFVGSRGTPRQTYGANPDSSPRGLALKPAEPSNY
jgi:hypothetical protein